MSYFICDVIVYVVFLLEVSLVPTHCSFKDGMTLFPKYVRRQPQISRSYCVSIGWLLLLWVNRDACRRARARVCESVCVCVCVCVRVFECVCVWREVTKMINICRLHNFGRFVFPSYNVHVASSKQPRQYPPHARWRLIATGQLSNSGLSHFNV